MEIGQVLTISNVKNAGSVNVMDTFEGIEGDVVYDTLCLKCGMNLMDENVAGNPIYKFDLYVERAGKKKVISSAITFTKLKKELINYPMDTLDDYSDDSKYVLQEVISECFEKNKKLLNDDRYHDLFFDIPVEFRAQNSRNRTGYGNEYMGDMLMYEGTLYGETTKYAFVGIRIKKWD